jgi:hypothetical protein
MFLLTDFRPAAPERTGEIVTVMHLKEHYTDYLPQI